jgi:starvation-inducible outer membrane lipoprotein
MRHALIVCLTVLSLALALAGCGPSPSDIQKDRMDPESLKALKNPPPGMPGAPPQSQNQAPNVPAGGAAAPGK